MGIDRLFNPLFLYRNRERIIPYLAEHRNRLVRPWTLWPFKDRHRGERCFIIGNGPSLKICDLDKLKSEVTFAANKIYLAFDQTDWRPSYYVVEDDHMIRQHQEEICRLRGFVKFISNDWRSLFRGEREVIMYPRNLLNLAKFPRFSGNAFRNVYCGYMVTYISLQLAYFMGFTRVYLIGVDFNYSFSQPGSGTIAYAADHSPNHFTPHYFRPGERLYSPQLDLAAQAMLCAKTYYEARGRKIWNATRGGKLELFDRISLEEALAN